MRMVMRVLLSCVKCCWNTASRSNNFIIGLTNVSPVVSSPTLWNYTLCGQYPGVVPSGATVSLYCQNNTPPFRYLIAQIPRTDYMNFCELEVIAPGISHCGYCPKAGFLFAHHFSHKSTTLFSMLAEGGK